MKEGEVLYPIRYTVNPSTKIFAINELEKSFFECLSSNLTDFENSKIKLLRMLDGALTVEYNRYPIRKVKLQGRKYWIQVLKGTYTTKTFEGKVEMLLSHIEEWVKYLRKL